MDDALAMHQDFDLRLGNIEEPARLNDFQPLFISVAESIVILAPIFQFGCCRARSGLTS
jgi:hypothetical protein